MEFRVITKAMNLFPYQHLYFTTLVYDNLCPVFCGKVDAILITGGIAYSKYFTGEITRRVQFMGPVTVLPGENELEALAPGCLRVLRGEEQAHTFAEA